MSDNNHRKIICLEGLPGTGKTSVLSKFRMRRNIKTIDEIVLNSHEPFNQNFVIRNDLEKFRMAYKFSCNTIVDRGYASTIAHDYALKLENQDLILKSVAALEEAKKLSLLPSHIIYINIDVENSILRKNRSVSNDIWTQSKYLDVIKEFYEKRMQDLFKTCEIIEVNGYLTIENIYQIICKKCQI